MSVQKQMKTIKSIGFVDFSIYPECKNLTVAQVQASMLAARKDVEQKLTESKSNLKATAWSEEFNKVTRQKYIVVKVLENQQDHFEAFSEQYANSN